MTMVMMSYVVMIMMLVALKIDISVAVQGQVPDCKGQKQLLDAHNDYRRKEGASDMKKLIWKDTLAEGSMNYTMKCVWEHGDLDRPDLPYKIIGQNLYNSKNKVLDFNDVIMSWFIEKSDYNFDTTTCAVGKQCGHYTQVVWANTSEVGCGYTTCPQLIVPGKEPLRDFLFVDCSYGPTGNYQNVPPFQKGDGCSQCPDGFKNCEDGLCSSGEGYGEINLLDRTCNISNSISTIYPSLVVMTTMAILPIMVFSRNEDFWGF